MPTDQAMLTEAIAAARAGDKARAKDLLTRLLRIDKDYPEHWLWMSAVVETRQEQIYCLENLLRVDPGNPVARRGLILMGALTVDPKQVSPHTPRRKNPWEVTVLERPRGFRALLSNPALRLPLVLLAGLLSIAMIAAGVVGVRQMLPPTPTPDFGATAAAVGQVITLTPSPTVSPTATPKVQLPTPTPARPTPLALLLEATYTPTPLYVNTPHPETEAFRLGMNAQLRGDWPAVINFMQQAIEISPDAADAYYYLGNAYLAMDDPALALEAFQNALLVDSQFGPAHLGWALARLALNPAAEVDEDFERAIALSADFGPAYLERARHRIANAQYEAAARDLDFAETLLPDSPLVPYLRAVIAFDQGEPEAALPLAEAAHEGDFTHLPTYRLLGEIHLALGDPAAAIQWLQTYLLYQPGEFDAMLLLADAHAESGSLQEAIGMYDQLLRLHRTDPDLYLGRGLVFLELGDATAALDDLNQANRLRRNDFEIMLSLGRALIAAGDPGDAYIQLLETFALAETEEELALAYFYRGWSLALIVENGDESSRPAAVRDLEAAVARADVLPPDLMEIAQTLLAALSGDAGNTPAPPDSAL